MVGVIVLFQMFQLKAKFAVLVIPYVRNVRK